MAQHERWPAWGLPPEEYLQSLCSQRWKWIHFMGSWGWTGRSFHFQGRQGVPLVQAEGKNRASPCTYIHPCTKAAHGAKLERLIVWTMFSSGGVLQRTGLGLVPLWVQGYFCTPLQQEQRQLKVTSKSLMPRNASAALEAGSWVEIPICVILSNCFLLCLWAFI